MADEAAAAAAAAQTALATAMTGLARSLTAQQEAQENQRRAAGANLESVKMPLFDGSTDVEDFIQLFNHLADLYNWGNPLKLAKLKTSLGGKAADCANPDTADAIFTALRAKFGITAEEAKRSLLAMKSGYLDRLRELGDRIQKLVGIAYPGLNADMLATLSLDQFKRCVHPELSVFMISRPPLNLDDAVRLCSEYASAGAITKGRRMQISSAEVTPRTDPAPEINAFEHSKMLTQQDLKSSLNEFQKTMSGFMKTMMTTCAEAIKTEVSRTPIQAPPPSQPWKQTTPPASTPQKLRLPPSPCTCGKMHWYRDCPTRKQTQQSGTKQNKKQEN